MKRADSHLHLFRNGFPGIYGRPLIGSDIEVYEALRKAHDVEAGLIVGYEAEGFDPDNNAYIRSLAQSRPWMITLAYVEPAAMPTAEALSRLFADGHRGVAIYIMNDAAEKAVSAWPASAWEALDRHRAIVSLNILPEYTPVLDKLAKSYKQCTWLVSHLGLPGSYKTPPTKREAKTRLAALLDLADLSNIMVKVSGLYAISDPSFAYPHTAAGPFMDAVLESFGSDRCLWGSDYSPALEHVSFAQTLSFPWLERQTGTVQQAIAGGNLLKLIGSV